MKRPFISRVDPKEQIGLNPARKLRTRIIRKKGFTNKIKQFIFIGNPILQRHREWLEQFKSKIREKKEEQEIKERIDQEKFERVTSLFFSLIFQD